ncbi:hypothetical protein HBA54_27420 [Pelagibius litoralis]|uniref:Uncharacterized protein n=1 Tax=Pelagibius litoralis TaxID=374515 RepID=A0A967F3R2_9PROT|nr:hypothetical protein [Pelagibius litoralis]NIA72325.1 hypothetical protein [Pelagibius litoralis]
MIDSSPQAMHLAIDPHEHFVQMPWSWRTAPLLKAALPYLGSKLWVKSVPPETHRLVANVDAALEQQIFDLAQRQRTTDVYQPEADHLG